MSTVPLKLEGVLFDGEHPVAEAADLTVTGHSVSVVAKSGLRNYGVRDITLSPRIGEAPRFIGLPDGSQFQCLDRPELDRLEQEQTEHLVARLEANLHMVVATIITLVVLVVAGYFKGLPMVAEFAVNRIDLETEAILGERALAQLNDFSMIAPSKLSKKRRQRIHRDFKRLIKGLPAELHYRLEIHNAPDIGANAFAFPGGIIIMTDQLVELAEHRHEISAVLAHEIGHVEKRHALRQIVQNSVTAIAITAISGDVSSLGNAGLVTLLVQTNYSRAFETEADDFAFDLLKQRGISPEHFANIMLRMSGVEKAEDATEGGFLTTHPMTKERIDKARAASVK